MLLLLNGPPGVGKSTLAARYVDEHPLALNLDIDLLRGQLGGWRDDPLGAGVAARALALAAARTHLRSGHDVVVPQFLGRAEFIDQLAALALEVGVDFVEVVLLDGKENVLRRFEDRGDTEKAVESAELSTMYDRLAALTATRPQTRTVRVHEGRILDTYAALIGVLSG